MSPGHPGGGEEFTLHRDEVHDTKRLSEFDFEDVVGVERITGRDRKNSLDLAHLLIVPNLTFNRQETLGSSAKGRVIRSCRFRFRLKKGRPSCNAGSVIQPLQVSLINELNTLKSSRRTDFVSVGRGVLVYDSGDGVFLLFATCGARSFEDRA